MASGLPINPNAWPRVAVFTGNYNGVVDGVALTTNKQVSYLESQGLPVRVYAPIKRQAALAHTGTLVPVPSVPLPRTVYRVALGLRRRIREDLEKFDPDLVHLASPDWLGFAALEWARRRKIPAVSTFHTYFNSYLNYYHLGFLDGICWRLQRWFYDHCQETYVACESMADVLRLHGIRRNLVIAPFGVDQANFSPQRRSDDWRRLHGAEPNDIVIGFVGRLVWEKSLDLWAKVVRRLETEQIPHKSMIIGEGPAGETLRQRLPNTCFVGRLSGSELGRAFAGLDLFFHPSASETFGCVTIEALASGLACVVANATGSRDIIRANIDGIVCPPHDDEAFYRALVELIRNAELRAKFRAAALERATVYRWETVLGQMLANFRRVARPRKGTLEEIPSSSLTGVPR
jgi:glycosyltransferase involved in cell wall biosynthesis